MNIQDLQEIIKLMEGASLSELSLEEESFKLSLKRETNARFVSEVVAEPLPQSKTLSIDTSLAANQKEEKGIHCIKAPMVGTFYAASSPETRAFVQKGDKVKPDSVVCILEAMKVMNEIHAECTGEILEVLVSNGAPVEYGQPLFRVKLDTV